MISIILVQMHWSASEFILEVDTNNNSAVNFTQARIIVAI